MLGRIGVDIIGWFFTECCCLDTNVIQTFSGTARLICIDHDTEWHSDDRQSVALSPWGASSITRGHKGTMAGRTVASQRIKQWSDGLRTDCDQFWTHLCHIVLKMMILMVVSSTTTLFSFLLVDICFLSDLVMHPWCKITITQFVYKKLPNIFQTYFFTIGTTLPTIHAYTGGHANRHHPKKSCNH